MTKYQAFFEFWARQTGERTSHTDVADRTEFVDKLGQTSFGGGAYKILARQTVAQWNDRVHSLFPRYAGKVMCFGFDWRGRVFGMDRRTAADGENVLIFDPCTGDVLATQADFDVFHNFEIVNYPDDCVALSIFYRWKATNRNLTFSECVGFKVPLILGGKDTPENLEICDVEVFWDLLDDMTKQINGGGWLEN